MVDLPISPRSHEIGRWAERFVSNLLPPSWTITAGRPEYGIDLEVEIFERNNPTGLRFGLQVKGTEHLKTSGGQICCRLKVRTLNYHLIWPNPVLLIICDIKAKVGYWLWIKEYILNILEVSKPEWSGQQTVTVRIPIANVFDGSTPLMICSYLKQSDAAFGAAIIDLINAMQMLKGYDLSKLEPDIINKLVHSVGEIYESSDSLLRRTDLKNAAQSLLHDLAGEKARTRHWRIR
jgi:hypothetical protein